MPRQVRLRELLVGVEGLALLRGRFTGTNEAAQRRIDDVGRILADPGDDTYAAGTDGLRGRLAAPRGQGNEEGWPGGWCRVAVRGRCAGCARFGAERACFATRPREAG